MAITFIRGLILGFSMSILFIGPSLFALIQTSIKTGFRSAAVMAAGISFSDVLLVLVAYWGAAQLQKPAVEKYEGMVGSAVLFGFGIFTLFQKHSEEDAEKKGLAAVSNGQSQRYPLMFIKGFFLNILNPFVLLLWISVMASVHHLYTKPSDLLFFFAGTLSMILTLDLLKSLGANRLRKILTHTLMMIIHYVMAIALIVSGAVLLYDVIKGGFSA